MLLCRLIQEQKPCIYVCAPLHIEIAIREALLEVLEGNEANPKEHFESMQKNHLYIKELWG